MTEYLTTRELAELLRIKERKVYDLVASGKVPYSKATGKLLFAKDAINAWIRNNSPGALGSTPVPITNIFLGSHDPLLEWALRESQCGIATYFDGSLDGIERFAAREGIATGLHVYDRDNDNWNINLVRQRCGDMPVVLVHWAKRMRGLVVNHKLQNSVKSITDIKGLRFVPRQEKAGSHVLFQHFLQQAGLDMNDIKPIPAERTEVDTARCVLEGKADFTFGLEAVASQHRLPFVPLIEEHFDILVDRRSWFEPGIQKLLQFCASDSFKQRARELDGYDITEFASVRFNGTDS